MFTMSRLSISSASSASSVGEGSTMPSDLLSTSAFSSSVACDDDATSVDYPRFSKPDPRMSSLTRDSIYAAFATEPPSEEAFILEDGESDYSNWWPASTTGNFQQSDDMPSPAHLEEAGELPVYNADGVELPFKHLFVESQSGDCRQLIIFIRHFFCRACKAYLKKLKRSLPQWKSSANGMHSSVQIPTNIILVSSMAPSLIRRYVANNDIPYPVYSDPSRQVFRALGCKKWGWYGPRPKYLVDESALTTASLSLLDNYTQALQGKACGRGAMFQVGGEFLFEDGGLVWCHRMTHMRDHTEVDELLKVLDLDDGEAAAAAEHALDEQRRKQEEETARLSKSLPATNPSMLHPDRGKTPNKLKKKNSRLWSRGSGK